MSNFNAIQEFLDLTVAVMIVAGHLMAVTYFCYLLVKCFKEIKNEDN